MSKVVSSAIKNLRILVIPFKELPAYSWSNQGDTEVDVCGSRESVMRYQRLNPLGKPPPDSMILNTSTFDQYVCVA